MKLINRFAGCSAVMLAMVLSGWAAEQAGGHKSEVKDQLIPAAAADGTKPSSVVRPPSPFSAEIGADFIKKVMETSAKIEEAKRQIAERQAQLYATNPEIKSTRARMIEGQKEINRILDTDQELIELKMSRDILWSTMPALPKGQNPASMSRMPVAR